MKYKVLICSAIMIASVLDSYSQGVRVHLKNGTSVDYPYAQIDSLVAYGIYNDDPIEVKTNEDITVNGSMATVSGSIKGVDSDMEVGFIYGMNQELTEFSKKKVKTMSHDKFSMPIKGLIDDTTYYYRAYAVVDATNIKSTTKTDESEKSKEEDKYKDKPVESKNKKEKPTFNGYNREFRRTRRKVRKEYLRGFAARHRIRYRR